MAWSNLGLWSKKKIRDDTQTLLEDEEVVEGTYLGFYPAGNQNLEAFM